MLTYLLPFLALALPADAGEWPQYRGPGGDGVAAADTAPLLRTWDEGEPKVVWRQSTGDGFSAVTAAGGRLFTLSLLDTEAGAREMVLALDPATGDELWRHPLGEAVESSFGNGPRSTPSVDGETVYAISSRAQLVALEVADGAVRWRFDLAEGSEVPRFGYSMSPLVDGDLVIVEAGAKEATGRSVVALDKATGGERWRALDGPAGYATPIAVELSGVRQYVFSRRQGPEIVSLSTSGEVLWRHQTQAMATIPMPVFVPPDRFFVASSDDDFGGLLVRVSHTEAGFEAERVWQERLMRNHFNTSVVVGGFLYGFDNATFKCLELETGDRRWAKRGFGKGSLIAAGDRLLVLADDGALALVEATPEQYREHGRIQAMNGKAWTAPSLAGGMLLLRDQDEIVALDLRGEGAAEKQLADARGREIVSRYAEARGGLDRWRQVRSVRLEGSYAAFSETSSFVSSRLRPHYFRLDFELLGAPAVRARDATGPWMLHRLLAPQASYLEEDPYKRQLERESHFAPLLLEAEAQGASVSFLGEGDVDGRATIDLELTLADGHKEIWHLDVETYLEVAVDSEVFDYTQLPKPMRQRVFYDDFRAIDGILLPFRIDWEFGARLESMTVERAEIGAPVTASDFTKPVTEDPLADGADEESR